MTCSVEEAYEVSSEWLHPTAGCIDTDLAVGRIEIKIEAAKQLTLHYEKVLLLSHAIPVVLNVMHTSRFSASCIARGLRPNGFCCM